MCRRHFFMHTPMQMKYATGVAHRRYASRKKVFHLLDCIGCVGKLAELLHASHAIDEGCYGEFCLYSPLTGGLSVDGEDAGNLYAGDLTAYGEQIMDAIKKDEGPDGQVRGLMHYFDRDRTVAAKVAAAWPSVREMEGELYGVLECKITKPLTVDETNILKDY